MIPKTIHYCWYGQGEKSDLIKKCINSWTEIMPDFNIKEWNESNSPTNIPYLQTTLKNKKYSNAANLTRYYALAREGGIYLDTDVEAIKTFSPLLEHKCFIGFQSKRIISKQWVNNATMGSVKGFPFMEKMFKQIQRQYDGTEEANLSSPRITTDVLREMGLNEYKNQKIEDINIYTHEFFSPGIANWYNERAHGEDLFIDQNENTYCIHHYELSWKKPQALKI
jgi:mannosyltransferase OCH1-like enzyme